MLIIKALPRPHSLKAQLLVWLLLMLIPLLIIGTLLSYYRANYFANLAYDRSLFRMALSLADQVEVVNKHVTADLPQIARDMLEFDKDDTVFYCIRDHQNAVVSGLANLPLPKKLPLASQHLYYDVFYKEEPLRIVAYNLPLAGTSLNGSVIILVAETRFKRTLMADEIITTMMMPQLLMMVLTVVLAGIAIQRGLIPLEKLRIALGKRSIEDLSPIVENTAPRELQPFLHTINDLIVRLNASVLKQQRFVADASHQLRTPLAGLKTQAELALRSNVNEQTKYALEHIHTSTSQLTQLVTQLLSLYRVEPEASMNIELKPISLLSLCQEAIQSWVPKALLKNIDLGMETHVINQTISPNTSWIVQGNVTLLQELVNNLVDNAIRYTQFGGKITVVLVQQVAQIILSVQDNGSGIAETERERVFERFYRILGTNQEGCGLGLTIVKEIALRHHAQISIEYTNQAKKLGTKISIEFSIQH